MSALLKKIEVRQFLISLTMIIFSKDSTMLYRYTVPNLANEILH